MTYQLTRQVGVRIDHGFGQYGVTTLLPGPVDGNWLKSTVGEEWFRIYLADGTLINGD